MTGSDSFDSSKIKDFFERVKEIGIIQRIFFWKGFLNRYAYDAYAEYGKLDSYMNEVSKSTKEIADEKMGLEKKVERLSGEAGEKDKIISELRKDNQIISEKKSELESELSKYKTVEEKSRQEFEKNMSRIDEIKKHYETEIEKLKKERENEIRKEQETRERAWKEHETAVEETIKTVCSKYTIDYISKEKFPHKGAPDNSILIAGEYVIFDAKAPKSNDPKKFRTYVKEQAEKLEKYAKLENVKKDMFLVVPTNMINEFGYKHVNVGSYRVYIVSVDSLEPIILNMKMIENYENVAELSPEDRENITSVIGRFANTAKRRIQIDHFFAEQSIKDLMECNSLPDEIKNGAVLVEKSTKLNPPQQRRAKETTINTLSKYVRDIEKEGKYANINMNIDSKKIENIPLDKKKSSDSH